MVIREALDTELDSVLAVQRAAFESDEECDLVRALLEDPTAQPALSLLALDGEDAVGHILFTAARLDPPTELAMSLLAPLAVVPDRQKQGIGGALIREGLHVLAARGTALVFVLGYPDYYPRHGFKTAGVQGFEAPYPIPARHADAWMVQELQSGELSRCSGMVLCADAISRPEYWVE